MNRKISDLPPSTDSLTILVRKMRPRRYTVKDAAFLVGKSPDTLKRWRQSERCIPSDSIVRGSKKIPLYTNDDLVRLRQIAAILTAGRKPIGYDPNVDKDPRHRV